MQEDAGRGNPRPREHRVALGEGVDLRRAGDLSVAHPVGPPHPHDRTTGRTVAHELHRHGRSQERAHLAGRAGDVQGRQLGVAGIAPHPGGRPPGGQTDEPGRVGMRDVRGRRAHVLLPPDVLAVVEDAVDRQRVADGHARPRTVMYRVDLPPADDCQLPHLHESTSQEFTGASAGEKRKIRSLSVLPWDAHTSVLPHRRPQCQEPARARLPITRRGGSAPPTPCDGRRRWRGGRVWRKSSGCASPRPPRRRRAGARCPHSCAPPP